MSIQVNPIVSPRIITIPATDGPEIDIQSLVTQIRIWEATQVNMSYPRLLSASGKEDLGGSVMVGITAKLENAKVMFEARLTPTICKVSGGNLVAVDINGATMYPLAYSDNVMATITASSSTTLQEMSAIQYSSFNGGVTIDVVNGIPGTAYPIGTAETPSSNFAQAKEIALSRGFKKFFIIGDYAFITGEAMGGLIFIGESKSLTHLAFDACMCEGTQLEKATLSGGMGEDCNLTVIDCQLGYELLGLTNLSGEIKDSVLKGDISLHAVGSTMFINCVDGFPGAATPIIRVGTATSVSFNQYSGGLTLMDLDHAANISVYLAAGRLIVDSSVEDGTILVKGVGICVNNSTGTTEVDVTGLIGMSTISKAVWDEGTAEHSVVGSFGAFVKNLLSRLDFLTLK
jgi:hypothetical protein